MMSPVHAAWAFHPCSYNLAMHVNRPARRPPILIGSIAIAAAVLATVYVVDRQLIPIVLALGAVIAASMVFYEVRLTKRIAQADFIFELNEGFAGNSNIQKLWKKLLLGKPIGPNDRHFISSYLTFFEALYIMIGRGVIDFALIDNLFRNRFFAAIGNPDIQKVLVYNDTGGFQNIHYFAGEWRQFLRNSALKLPDSYFSYAHARLEAKGVRLARITLEDLPEVLALQETVAATITGTGWLRENDEESFRDCIQNHTALAARSDGRMVGAAILVNAGHGAENIQRYLTDNTRVWDQSCNLKVVLVHPESQRLGLARVLVESLERQAISEGMLHMLCTIHPHNRASQALFEGLGYFRKKRVQTSYGKRNVFQRELGKSQGFIGHVKFSRGGHE